MAIDSALTPTLPHLRRERARPSAASAAGEGAAVMIKRIFLWICLALAGAWVVRTFLFEAVVVASGSMEPTLEPGTHFLVNKWIYRFRRPQRGDIVSLNSPVD